MCVCVFTAGYRLRRQRPRRTPPVICLRSRRLAGADIPTTEGLLAAPSETSSGSAKSAATHPHLIAFILPFTSSVRGASDDETEASADEGRADPGTAEADQTASTAEGTLGRGTRRAATSTDYGGPVTRRRRADDGEAEQSRRARRGREQDVAEISRRMYEEIRSSRDPRDHVEDG